MKISFLINLGGFTVTIFNGFPPLALYEEKSCCDYYQSFYHNEYAFGKEKCSQNTESEGRYGDAQTFRNITHSISSFLP
jgi:hypothetical protein